MKPFNVLSNVLKFLNLVLIKKKSVAHVKSGVILIPYAVFLLRQHVKQRQKHTETRTKNYKLYKYKSKFTERPPHLLQPQQL